MKRHWFTGVTLHPKEVRSDSASMIGIWIWRPLSQTERERIMSLNGECPGHIGIIQRGSCAAIMYLARLPDASAARRAAACFARKVASITRSSTILRQLPSNRSIRQALLS